MTDQTIAPMFDSTPARSDWDSPLAPVVRGVGTLLIAATFVPLLPVTVTAPLVYFGLTTWLLGTVLGVVSAFITFWQYIGADAHDEQLTAFKDRVDHLRMSTWLHFTLFGVGIGSFLIAAATPATPGIIATWVVAAVCAFTGIRTIIRSVRIWSHR